MQDKIKHVIALLFLSLFISHASLAEPLRVGIVEPVPPFIIHSADSYSGITIDIWQTIASNENLNYKYVLLNEKTNEAIKALHRGDIDVLLGPVSMTSERYDLVTFSYPYFLNEIGIVEHKPPTGVIQIAHVFADVLDSPFLIFFIVFFIVYIHILWLFEKKYIPNFPKGYRRGMSHVLWLHLLQNGLKDVPYTLWGKLAAFAWILAAAVLVTTILATVTSKLTLALGAPQGEFVEVGDLQDLPVAAVKGTHSISEAEKIGAQVIPADSIGQAIEWLSQNKVRAVVEDYIIAKHYIDTHKYSDLQLSPLTISNDEYAFAVQKNNLLVRKINHQLLILQDNDSTLGMCARYIGQDARACKL